MQTSEDNVSIFFSYFFHSFFALIDTENQQLITFQYCFLNKCNKLDDIPLIIFILVEYLACLVVISPNRFHLIESSETS
jgi:hypothetical protein